MYSCLICSDTVSSKFKPNFLDWRGDRPSLLPAPFRLHPSLPDVQREPAEPHRVPRRPRVRRGLHRHHDSLLGVKRVHRINQHDVCASGKLLILTSRQILLTSYQRCPNFNQTIKMSVLYFSRSANPRSARRRPASWWPC